MNYIKEIWSLQTGREPAKGGSKEELRPPGATRKATNKRSEMTAMYDYFLHIVRENRHFLCFLK